MTDIPLERLGPLARLAATWEGQAGEDVAPSDDRGTESNKCREHDAYTTTAQDLASPIPRKTDSAAR